MDKIKSAWEIALEKTSSIKADKKSLAEKEAKAEGKKIASHYLENDEKFALDEALEKLPKAERKAVEQGILETLLANLVLPITDLQEQRNRRAIKGLVLFAPQEKNVAQILHQIEAFFKNFRHERERIEKALENQYEPRLRQKEAALAKQLGAMVELKAAQDPEFVALLKKNLAAFDERFTEALNEAKAEIERLISKVL